MIFALALAFVAAAPAPASAPTPLREVVYKVSSLRTQSLSIETYGGQVANPDSNAPGASSASEAAPSAKRNATLEEGTLTVDVLGLQLDVIRVSVTERFNSHPAPRSYEAYIAPNGLVRFETDQPSPIARYLLPLFATKFAATESFAPGDTWHVDLKTDAVDVQNIFTIAGQDGAILLLDERGAVKMVSARGLNYNVYGKLKYKPSLLVPIAGDINEKGSRSTMDSVDELATSVHFERISDTRDTAPSVSTQSK